VGAERQVESQIAGYERELRLSMSGIANIRQPKLELIQMFLDITASLLLHATPSTAGDPEFGFLQMLCSRIYVALTPTRGSSHG
jgi:hypothetical protein